VFVYNQNIIIHYIIGENTYTVLLVLGEGMIIMMIRVGSISLIEIARNNVREQQYYEGGKKIDKSEDCTFQKLLDTEMTKLNKK